MHITHQCIKQSALFCFSFILYVTHAVNNLFHINKRLQIVLNSLEMLCDFLDFRAFYLEIEKHAEKDENRTRNDERNEGARGME